MGEAVTAAMTSARTAVSATALTATLGLAAASWALTIRQMSGMDMGVATRLGSFAFFAGLWVLMMAAMMLPGAVPAVLRGAHASGSVRAVPLFLGSYLAVWALVGVVVYALYRPHGTVAAGVIAIAAGIYELTPLKQHFRQRCHESFRSGFGFGALLRRLEHRFDADARGVGGHEPHLDVRYRHPRRRPEALASEGRYRCTSGASDRRARGPDSDRPVSRTRSHATDVRHHGQHRDGQVLEQQRQQQHQQEKDHDGSPDRNA